MVLLVAGGVALVLAQVAQPRARASEGVSAWEASANAAVVGVSPSASGVFLTSTIGEAYAAYDQSETQATSALVNLGGLGYAVASSPICGQALSLSDQPQPLTADSTSGASSKTTQAQLAPGVVTPSGTGTEHVAVSVHPESAEARTYPVSQDVPGVANLGGVAQSEVHYVDGQLQAASASVTETLSLLGGLVTFNGLSWNASQQRGVGDPANAAGFSYSSITISGTVVPVSIPATVPLATAIGEVNAVLGTLGVTVTAPSQKIDPGTGGISMSPLQVHFSGSAIDNQLVGPAVGPITQIINVLNGQVTHGTDCSDLKNLLGELSTIPETGLGLLLSGLSGSGALDLYFGGASADTLTAPSFSNPFDSGGALGATPLPPSGISDLPLASPGAAAPLPLSGAESGSSLALPASSPKLPASVSPQAKVAATRCVTTSPAGGSGCWRGLATWAAGVATLLGGGLLAADVVYSRRTPRPSRRRRRLLI